MSFKALSKSVHGVVKSKFVRNVAVVASGTAAAQTITMAFAPIVTRLYGPDAFGLLGVFMAVSAILAPLAALTYPLAIVLPREDADAKGIVKLSLCVAIAVSAVSAVVLYVGGEGLLRPFDLQVIAPYAMLLPLAMFFVTCVQISQQWLNRKKQYSITARVAVLQALLLNSVKAGFGWLNPVGPVLVILATVGQSLHAAMLWLGVRRTMIVADAGRPMASLKELAKTYSDFPLYRAPQVFLNTVSHHLPVLMLAGLFGVTSAGFYSIVKAVMDLPVNLIGKSISDVFYPRISESVYNGENLTGLILRATGGLAVIGFLPFAIVAVFGPRLFQSFFGPEWLKAGEYARWLTLFYFFNFINKPVVAAVPVLKLQRGLIMYEALSTGSKIIALITGFFVFQSDAIAVIAFSGTGAIAYLFLIIWVVSESCRREEIVKAAG